MIRSLSCTRPENRTPIARLRILSTNRYTSRAFYFWDCNGKFFLLPNFFCAAIPFLFQEHEEHRHYKADEGRQMVPLQSLPLEH